MNEGKGMHAERNVMNAEERALQLYGFLMHYSLGALGLGAPGFESSELAQPLDGSHGVGGQVSVVAISPHLKLYIGFVEQGEQEAFELIFSTRTGDRVTIHD